MLERCWHKRWNGVDRISRNGEMVVGACMYCEVLLYVGQAYSWNKGVTSITEGDAFNKVGNASSKSIIDHMSTVSYTFFITANEEEFIVTKVQVQYFFR